MNNVIFAVVFLIAFIILVLHFKYNYFNNVRINAFTRLSHVFNIINNQSNLSNIFKNNKILSDKSYNDPILCKTPQTKLTETDIKMEIMLTFKDVTDKNYDSLIEAEIKGIIENNTGATVININKTNNTCNDSISESFIKERITNNDMNLIIELSIKKDEPTEVVKINNNQIIMEPVEAININDNINNKIIIEPVEAININNNIIEPIGVYTNDENNERLSKMREIEIFSEKTTYDVLLLTVNISKININKNTIILNNEINEINDIIKGINIKKITWQAESTIYTNYTLKTINLGELNNYPNFKNMLSYINDTITNLNISLIEKQDKINEITLDEIENYSTQKTNDINVLLSNMDNNNIQIDQQQINKRDKIINKLTIITNVLNVINVINEEWKSESFKYNQYIKLLQNIKYINYNNFNKNTTEIIKVLNLKKQEYNTEIIRINIILQNAESELLKLTDIKSKVDNIMLNYEMQIDIFIIKTDEKITFNEIKLTNLNNIKEIWINVNNEFNLHNEYTRYLNEMNEYNSELNRVINKQKEERIKIKNTFTIIENLKTQYTNIKNDENNILSTYKEPIIHNILFNNNSNTNKITNDLQNVIDTYNNIIDKLSKLLLTDNVSLNEIIIQYYDKLKTEYDKNINIYKNNILNKLLVFNNEIIKEKQILDDFNKIKLIKKDQYCAAKEINIGQSERYKGSDNIKNCYLDLKHNSQCRQVADSFMINPDTGDCYCYIFTDCDRLWDEKSAHVYKMNVDENTQNAINIAFKRIKDDEETARLKAIEQEKLLKQMNEDKTRIYKEARGYLLTDGDVGMNNGKYILSTHDEYCASDSEYKVGQDLQYGDRYRGKTGPQNCYTDLQEANGCKFADGFMNNLITGDCYCYMNNYCDAYRFRMTIEPYNALLFDEHSYNIHLKEIFSQMFDVDINFIQIYHDNNLIQIILNKISPNKSEILKKEMDSIINNKNKTNELLNKIKNRLPNTTQIKIQPLIKNTRWSEDGAFIFQINQSNEMLKWAKDEAIRLTRERQNSALSNRLKKEEQEKIKREAELKYNNARNYLLNNNFKNGTLIGVDQYCGSSEKLVNNNNKNYMGNDAVEKCYSDMLSKCFEPIGIMTNIKDGTCYCYEKTNNVDSNNCTYKFPETGAFTYLLNKV